MRFKVWITRYEVRIARSKVRNTRFFVLLCLWNIFFGSWQNQASIIMACVWIIACDLWFVFRLHLVSVFGLACYSEACFQWHKIVPVLNLLFLSSGCVLTTYNISANLFGKVSVGRLPAVITRFSHEMTPQRQNDFRIDLTLSTTCPAACELVIIHVFCTAGPNVWDGIEKLGFLSFNTWKERKV